MIDEVAFGAVESVLTDAPAERSLGIKATIDPDAPCVRAMVAGGWTPTLRLVADQHGWGVTGLSHPGGGPRNPRDPEALPGGSSSGGAVAVAAGLVRAAVGSDTGGSIRIPAAWCSVVGYRPSTGRVSAEGIAPLSPSFDVPGLMTRDMGRLIEAARSWDVVAADLAPAELRITAVSTTVPMSQRARVAHEQTVELLRRHGVGGGTAEIDTRLLRRTFSTIQMAESVRSLAEVDPESFLPDVRVQHQAALQVTAEAEAEARTRWQGLAWPGPDDLLLLPTVGAEPPLRAQPQTVDTERGAVPTARAVVEPNVLAPLLRAPALTLPLADGSPFGLQLVARPGQDELLLGAAAVVAELLNLTPEDR